MFKKGAYKGELARIYLLGFCYQAGCLYGQKLALAQDADKWITVHPAGKGPKARGAGNKKGTPVRIDAETGEVKAGMGGKFNGKKISEVSKNSQPVTPVKKTKAVSAKSKVKTGGMKVAPKKAPVQTTPQPTAKEGTSPKVLSEGAQRLQSQMGEHHYGKMSEMVDKAIVPAAANLWRKFEGKMTMASTDSKEGSYFQPGRGVSINMAEVSQGKGSHKPYEVAFHELGHCLDHLVTNSADGYFSTQYKDGLFQKTMQKEFRELIDNKWKELKSSYESATDKKAWVREHQNLFVKGSDEFKKACKGKFMMPRDKAYVWLSQYLHGLPKNEIAPLSDMLSGITYNDERLGIKVGHSSNYWMRSKTALAYEAFAELTESVFANHAAYGHVKKLFPQTIKVYEEMLQQMGG